MDNETINQVLTEIITDITNKCKPLNVSVKCSNGVLRERYSQMSIDEKKEKLKDKLNPLEKEEYDDILDEIDELYECYGEEAIQDETTFAYEDYQYLTDRLFYYDKRMSKKYNPYSRESDLPVYDLDDFQVEKSSSDVEKIGVIEQNQIDSQKDMTISNEGLDILTDYFGSGFSGLNGELIPTYRKKHNIVDKDGYWAKLSEETRELYHEQNKTRVKELDKVMNGGQGLLVNTVLFHGTDDTQIVTINNRIGDKIQCKGYISTSFDYDVGKSYGEKGGGEGVCVRFLAPQGTKGFCANDNHQRTLTHYTKEHEYLLGRNNKGTLVDIDYENKIFTVLLE